MATEWKASKDIVVVIAVLTTVVGTNVVNIVRPTSEVHPVVLVVLGALGVHDEAVGPIVHVVLVVLGALCMHDELVVPVVLVVLVVRVAPGMHDGPVVLFAPIVLVVLLVHVVPGAHAWYVCMRS